MDETGQKIMELFWDVKQGKKHPNTAYKKACEILDLDYLTGAKKNHGVLHDVIPYLGTARLIKNNKGHSSIKNVTLGNSYQIIEKLDRSRLRKYNPKMNDGFWIINDLGKKVSFTNENLWDVSWV